MADLPVIGLGVYTDVTGTVKVGTDPVLEVIASADDADYAYASTNATGTYSAKFAIDAFPGTLVNVDTLSVQLRYHWQTGTQVNTWDSLTARVYKSDGTTPLTDAATLASSITTTTATNSTVVAFTGVDTAATAADWDGAVLIISWAITKVKGGDTLEKRVTAGQLTGTYTADTARLLSGTTAINGDWTTPGNLDVVHAAVLSGTTTIGGAGGLDTYYFDASIAGPTDPNSRYTNDANAFDGSTSTSADGTLQSVAGQGLNGTGTTAPTSGGEISQVRSRIYTNNSSGAARVLSGSDVLGTSLAGLSAGWGNWVILSAPSGGWTWTAANGLECQWYFRFADGAHSFFRAEIEVTSAASVWGTSGNLQVTSGPLTISAAGNIVSAEAFGTTTLAASYTVSTAGNIATAEAFGSHTLTSLYTIVPTGIASSEALGTTLILYDQFISSAGNITTAEAFGSATVLPVYVIAGAGDISSSEAFGTAVLSGIYNILGAGNIASGEAFGTHSLRINAIISDVGAIATGEAIGSLVLKNVNTILQAGGVTTGEGFGAPEIIVPIWYISPSSIATAEGIGAAIVTNEGGTQTVIPSSVPSVEAFGSVTVIVGGVVISGVGNISSAEAFGLPVRIIEPYIISGTGIVSAEGFGTHRLNRYILPSSIASEEAIGTDIGIEFASIITTGIPSEEAFGIPIITGGVRDWNSGNTSTDITRWITKDLTATRTEEKVN